MVTAKSMKRGRGRPRTSVQWKGISVRFTADEKIRLKRRAAKMNKSQADCIRQATVCWLDAG
jgi:hypothetical protein